jgi:hypothetical protein
VLATHHPLTAFYTGLATALGAGVSMAFSEGLSDTGDLTGRGTGCAYAFHYICGMRFRVGLTGFRLCEPVRASRGGCRAHDL